MKNFIVLTIILLILGMTEQLKPQIHISGATQSSAYFFDTPTVEQGNFYQSLRFRLSSEGLPGTYLASYARLAKIGDDSWDEQVYNLYLNWQNSNRKVQLRAGRQFLYEGVINGTVDGVMLAVKPAKKLTLKVVAGLESPFDRDLNLVGGDSSALGGYLSYQLPWDSKIDLSYFKRDRESGTVWHLVGASLTGTYRDNLYYLARVDQNLETEELQGMRYRLSYFYKQWSFSGEYSQQRPRILEDSFFRIFRQLAYKQTRAGVTYQLNNYRFGVQYAFTDYELDQGNQVTATFGNQWGIVGVIFQEGYGGENLGVYGEARYDILPQLTVRAYSSYYQYQRQSIQIDEEAIGLSGGLTWRPLKDLMLRAEVQESINEYYENDVRGLFRLRYAFSL